MIGTTLTVPPADLRRMDQLLAEIHTVTNRSMGKYVEKAAVMAVVSARKATPKGKKRPMKNISRRGKSFRRSIGAPWWATHAITSYRGGRERLIFAGDRDNIPAKRTPRFQGAAKAAWSGAIRKIGKNPGRIATGVSRVADSASRVRKASTGANLTSILIENRIRYIGKIAPQAAAIGIRNATARMEKVYLRDVERQISQVWRTGRAIAGGVV